jgi:glycosyltransferase involved in cell wall biosynthesis
VNASVLILTLNEEPNLPACLASLSWSDDVVVLDSGSDDRTLGIAGAAGARVVQRRLDNWADHQNFAARSIEYRHPWVYYTDADEVVTQELAEEIQAVAAHNDRPEVAYRVRFRNMLGGRWIRRSSMYPSWILRLFKPGHVRWRRAVNPVAEADGPVGQLENHFLHYSFNKGFSAWFEKHNRYSSQEAVETLRSLEASSLDWHGLLSREPARRRRALKELSFRVPCRPFVKFAYMYLLRMGFLDGAPGFTYCTLQAIYEYMICLKVKELRRREKGLAI